MIFADSLLARRLEAAEAANARGTTAQPGTAILEVDGGCAIFAGAESPLSHAVGIGLDGPVPAAKIDEIEAFFRGRGAPVTFDVCPLADPGFIETLTARGYRIAEFNNVLVRRLAGYEIVLTPRARRAIPGEEDLWSYTAGRGFFEHAALTDDEMNVGRAICAMPGALPYLAATETGKVAAAAALAIHGGLATLFADTTISDFRRSGLHRELIAARLNESLAQGADTATASTLPGSASQRNYERMGFQVVYTKLTLVSSA